MVRHAMLGDYDWDRSAETYVDLFQKAVAQRRAAQHLRQCRALPPGPGGLPGRAPVRRRVDVGLVRLVRRGCHRRLIATALGLLGAALGVLATPGGVDAAGWTRPKASERQCGERGRSHHRPPFIDL